MSDLPMHRGYRVATYLHRRAAAERAKALASPEQQDRALHHELAAIFEERALIADLQNRRLREARLGTAARYVREGERRLAQMRELIMRPGRFALARQRRLATVEHSLILQRLYLQRLLDSPQMGIFPASA